MNISFNQKINIIYGNNAQGKTNILESLYLLALTKSHRTSKDKELVRWDQSFSVIKCSLANRLGNIELEIQLNSKGKKAKVNHLEKRKLSEYIGTFNVVMFAPEDLILVKGSPQNRRKFLDLEIGQVSPSYIHHLSQFQKIIQQRNNLLKDFSKENKNKIELLDIWDVQMIEHGTKVMMRRNLFIDKLQKWANAIHADITDGKENIRISYKPSFLVEDFNEGEANVIKIYKNHLTKVRQQEIYRGTTLIGPHRDDLEFFVNDINVQLYGSQGQQRTTALSLKLAEIELIYEETGEYPILLLDDVLSELDKKRQTHLIKAIENKVQTMITTTSIDNIDFSNINEAFLMYVENGSIEKK